MNYSSTDSKASEETDTDLPTNGHSDNELLGSYEAFEDTGSSISDIDENNRKRPRKKESSQERNRKRRSTGKSYVAYKNKQVAEKKFCQILASESYAPIIVTASLIKRDKICMMFFGKWALIQRNALL